MTREAFRQVVQTFESHAGRQFSSGDQRQKLLGRTYQELANEDDAALIAAADRLMLATNNLPSLQALIDAVKLEGKARRAKAEADIEADAARYSKEARQESNILTNPPPVGMFQTAIKALDFFTSGACTRGEWLVMLGRFHVEYPNCGWDRARETLALRYSEMNADLNGYCHRVIDVMGE